jgi:glycerol-3-phosphate dehydrogenase (NAD(P)+)
MRKASFAVVGAGSYGTAIAHHFASCADHEVILYGRDPDVVAGINTRHHNPRYLAGYSLSPRLAATTDLSEAVQGAAAVFLAVPAQSMRQVIGDVRGHLHEAAVVISLAKGIEIRTLRRMSEIIASSLREAGRSNTVTALSGPSFARDVVDPEKSVALSLGGRSRRRLKQVREQLHSPRFRVFACRDLAGVEWGGALKNVFALMAGIMRGAGEGDSYLGEFIPRALVEIDTIKHYFGARRDTSRAVSSLGDLIISCSEASRNFRFGRAYVEGFVGTRSGPAAVEFAYSAVGSRTVEGYHTLQAIHRFVNEKSMFAPIIRELYDILYDADRTGKSPADAIASFRQADSLRTWENLRTYSRILGIMFPRHWYRRHRDAKALGHISVPGEGSENSTA